MSLLRGCDINGSALEVSQIDTREFDTEPSFIDAYLKEESCFNAELWKRRRSEDYEFDEQMNELLFPTETSKKPSGATRKKHKRSVKKNGSFAFSSSQTNAASTTNNDNTTQTANPLNSPWYINYVLHPDIHSTTFQKQFRLRFRLPHSEYAKLIDEIEDQAHFIWWSRCDATGVKASPLTLMVLP